ncbi:MAG: HXXEE domain-containing protein [Bacteroidetes bacterium]|nr:HXXEE domain-containing protein [Bacteroidota bacterium]
MKGILWCIPVLLLVHNLEEALTMPQWILLHQEMLRTAVPLFRNFTFSTTQLYLSLIQLSVIPVTISAYCIRGELTKRSLMLLMILQSIIFTNALVPHLIGTIILQMYNPGTVTAVAFNIPFTLYLFTRLLREGIIGSKDVRKAMIAGVLLYLPVVYLNHLLAHSIAKIL